MDFLSNSFLLFVALATAGTIVGIFFGSIPGLTATMAVAVALPITYSLDLAPALALLIGLYVGGISGGLIPAILLNIPGTPSSIATTFDGHPMASKGQGINALKISVVSSLFGGLFSALILFLFAPVLADFAIKFSYIEKFLVILFALTVIASLAKSVIAGLISGLLGILLSLVGTYDVALGGNGSFRLVPFESWQEWFEAGFTLLPVLIGVFGLSTILEESELGLQKNKKIKTDLSTNTFKFRLFKGKFINLFRSSSIGTFIGMLPGVGGSAASILAYSQEKNFSKTPNEMGKGSPNGLVASESANNALTGGAFIPMLALGIPGDSTTAILIGAFTLQGIQVGPLFINENLETWHFMIFALLIANIAMFFFMFFAIKFMVKIVSIPKYVLYPIILMMCVIGGYTINYGVMFDVWTVLIFGLLGYIGVKLGLEIPCFIIGFILGKSAEVYFMKSLESYGSLEIFFTKSYLAVILWVVIIVSVFLTAYLRKKQNITA